MQLNTIPKNNSNYKKSSKTKSYVKNNLFFNYKNKINSINQ